MTNFPNVRFYGENEYLPRKALPKPTFHHKPKHVSTYYIPTPDVKYPYAHIKTFSLHNVSMPNVHYKHDHLKSLHAEKVTVKQQHLQHPDELGIKEETKAISVPNEALYEMGIPNTNVKDFAIANLQEEAGTENNLVRHRDNHEYDNTSTLNFSEQYEHFLENKNNIRKADNSIDQTISHRVKEIEDSNVSDYRKKKRITRSKQVLLKQIEENAGNLPPELKRRSSQIRVEPIITFNTEEEKEDYNENLKEKRNKMKPVIEEAKGKGKLFFERAKDIVAKKTNEANKRVESAREAKAQRIAVANLEDTRIQSLPNTENDDDDSITSIEYDSLFEGVSGNYKIKNLENYKKKLKNYC